MQNYNLFLKVLNKLEGKVKLAVVRANDIRKAFNSGDIETAFAQSLRLETTVENAVLLARSLPAYTGNPIADREVREIVSSTIPVEIAFTEVSEIDRDRA